MGGGVVVGILRVRYPGRVVLRDGTVVFRAAKQAACEFAIGSSLTVSYTIKKDGTKLADGIWPCA